MRGVTSLVWGISFFLIAVTAFYWFGPTHLLRPPSETPAQIEEKNAYAYATAFVLHTSILSNKGVDAGPKVKWLSLCVFENSKQAESISYRRNFRLAYALIPAWEKPYVMTEWSTSWKPYYKLNTVLKEIVRRGHQREYDRILREMVIPFLGTNKYEMLPEAWRESCMRVRKMTRSYLAGLKTFRRWPNVPEIQDRLRILGYNEIDRVMTPAKDDHNYVFFGK